MVAVTFANDLKPFIESHRLLIARWSCSTMLFRYLDVRTSTRLVTVEFIASGESTEIVLTHERLPGDALAAHTGGWTDILNGLARSMGEKSV